MRSGSRARVCLVVWLIAALGRAGAAPAAAAEPTVYPARDTLAPAPGSTPGEVAALGLLAWEPGAFRVAVLDAAPDAEADAWVWFASPRPEGRRAMDQVPVHWYRARGVPAGERAPAVVLVHSLDPRLTAARTLARKLSERGVHALIVVLPGYGTRVGPPGEPGAVTALRRGAAAVSEVRRAVDAARALPGVDPRRVALQGTSLGGFFAATAGGLDGAVSPVLLVFSGGDGFGVLSRGMFDAAMVRAMMRRAGYGDAELRELLDPVDPLRLAARLPGDCTWLFVARADRVVPRWSSDALAAAAGLAPDHVIEVEGGHYTALLALPDVAARMAELLGACWGEPGAVAGP